MPPRSAFDVVTSHIRLPVSHDYNALKHVLRDWQQYNTQVPLQAKTTFPAEVLITITRLPPTAPGESKKKNSNGSSSALGLSSSTARTGSASSPSRSRRWSLWRSRTAASTAAQVKEEGDSTADAEQAATKPFVYRKAIPLHVWTAVLPWEMQRGLSFSDLALPSSVRAKGDSVVAARQVEVSVLEDGSSERPTTAPTSQSNENHTKSKEKVEEEEDDLYGVVTPVVSVAANNATSLASTSAHRPSTSVTAPVPAMLFLSDIPATKAYGIGFWSGGIRQPIDVLFVAPTLPTSVGPHSPSFEHLRNEDGRAAAEDNYVSREVLSRFFPLQEIRPKATSSSSSSLVAFHVHSFSYLDPLPPSLHPSRLDTEEGRAVAAAAAAGPAGSLSFTATPDAPYPSIQEAPRYVLEAPRHTLQPAVAAALRESRLVQHAQTGASGWADAGVRNKEDEDDAVSIDLTVNMSDALRNDIFAKAQLCVEYVSLLEDAIAYYVQELSTDRTAAAVAAEPLDTNSSSSSSASGDGGADGDNRPIKVWLSEHEARWMTPQELRKASQSVPKADEDSAEEMTHNRDASAAAEHDEDDAGAASSLASRAVTKDEESPTLFSQNDTAGTLAAQTVKATPAQPGAVSAARSISLQSPMLKDEEEGRPSYLAPSFVGRHESSTLRNSAVVLSADKLARYPQTHAHVPQLPPVDYELFDLCTRLGVGQRAILYHYHERILREWRAELQRRRSVRMGRGGAVAQQSAAIPPAIDSADVQRMVALVRDRSLQLSPELVSLVEAVVAAE